MALSDIPPQETPEAVVGVQDTTENSETKAAGVNPELSTLSKLLSQDMREMKAKEDQVVGRVQKNEISRDEAVTSIREMRVQRTEEQLGAFEMHLATNNENSDLKKQLTAQEFVQHLRDLIVGSTDDVDIQNLLLASQGLESVSEMSQAIEGAESLISRLTTILSSTPERGAEEPPLSAREVIKMLSLEDPVDLPERENNQEVQEYRSSLAKAIQALSQENRESLMETLDDRAKRANKLLETLQYPADVLRESADKAVNTVDVPWLIDLVVYQRLDGGSHGEVHESHAPGHGEEATSQVENFSLSVFGEILGDEEKKKEFYHHLCFEDDSRHEFGKNEMRNRMIDLIKESQSGSEEDQHKALHHLKEHIIEAIVSVGGKRYKSDDIALTKDVTNLLIMGAASIG